MYVDPYKTQFTLKELRAIADASTRVVGWYAHTYSGEVRGPFCRWLTVTGGDNGMVDPIKYPTPVSSIADDTLFAAAAMNNLVPLLDYIDTLKARIAELEAK